MDLINQFKFQASILNNTAKVNRIRRINAVENYIIPKTIQKLGFLLKMTYNSKESDTKISVLLLMVFVRFLLIESTQVRKGSTAGKNNDDHRRMMCCSGHS